MSAMSRSSAKTADIAIRGLRAARLPRRPPSGLKPSALDACCGTARSGTAEGPFATCGGDAAEPAAAGSLAGAREPEESGAAGGSGVLAGAGSGPLLAPVGDGTLAAPSAAGTLWGPAVVGPLTAPGDCGARGGSGAPGDCGARGGSGAPGDSPVSWDAWLLSGAASAAGAAAWPDALWGRGTGWVDASASVTSCGGEAAWGCAGACGCEGGC